MQENDQAKGPQLFTLGDLGVLLKTAKHRLKYAAQFYAISPAGKVGRTSFWTAESIPKFEAALRQMEINRHDLSRQLRGRWGSKDLISA